MSNQAVGNVYQSIIEEVINSSRVDFEESGVEESVLEELRQGWQQKLSQLDVARFPWDPKPEPAPPAQAAPPVQAPPSQNHTQAQFSPQLSLPNAAAGEGLAQNGTRQEPVIKQESLKQEPGVQNVPSFPALSNIDNKNVAASRAAQQLQLQYGMRAAGSINAIQNLGQQQQPSDQGGQGAGQPGQGGQQQVPGGANPAGHISNGQTDGAGDDAGFEGVLMQQGPSGNLNELGRVEIDRMLHEQIAARAKAMEGGGLMLPLKEATKHRTAKSKDAKGKGVAGFDGGDDDDEVDDEDAINSDLDDPEEDREDDEVDDEGLGHIMLCMYDKVQRVKNKWKCTLKDGVLTVNGKEYVFHKATGEYEW
ncbi:transcription factor IIA subunit alpha [Purpureocillium lilacinum]|uniref:Transcription initiation factor IIA large subunit n=1 Tax=Purpureocillium lilacinum TaxID=33203 RepID=A0A179GEC1_PURLI|nr:transcription factor IIA, alpha/beta subunit [Purpureocillium lilacinum]GJN70385.1 transcription factor IIA subunit alpha [Purpureocillium lilacinum]GJN79509.1 transcription factor IIA subunit alpha [Purpureocillium lilacinum]